MRDERADLVLDIFVELSDTLASDYDIGDFLHTLVERCEQVLQVDAGGVLLENPAGMGLTLAAATSEKMERLEQGEMRHDEGPCIDAYRRVEQVVAHNINDTLDRWPKVTPTALDLGLQSVFAFPLRLRGDCIGALNLYREQVGPFDTQDVRLAQAFADVAAIGILQARQIAAAEQRADQLQHALDSRVVIEQAKGVVMAKARVGPDEAFELLRKYARGKRLKLHAVCTTVVETQSTPDPDMDLRPDRRPGGPPNSSATSGA